MLIVSKFEQNAQGNAKGGAPRLSTRSRVCSSVRNAARRAFASRLVTTETRESAPATTTGRPREAAPNALKLIFMIILHYSPLSI